MIHHYYPKLFAEDPKMLDKALRLRDKTYEFSQFLVNVLGIVDVGAQLFLIKSRTTHPATALAYSAFRMSR